MTTRTSDLDRFARHVIHKESLRFWDFNSSSSVPDARVDVSAADALDLAVNSGLVALDEKARGPTPRRDHLHIAQQRLQVEGQVQEWLEALLSDWVSRLCRKKANGKVVVYFEQIRRACYDLYDRSLAYSTVLCLAQAVVKTIETAFGAEASVEADLLRSIARFLKLLVDDVAAFQRVNQANTHAVLEITAQLVERAASLQLQLAGYSNLGAGWRGELRHRLEGEARVLYEVYKGLQEAVDAIEKYEAFIDNLLSLERGRGERTSQDGLPNVSDAPISTLLQCITDARDRIADRIRRLNEANLDPACSIYASRLPPWREVLTTLEEALQKECENLVSLSKVRVQLRYCFPFAVKLEDDRLGDLPQELQPRIHRPDGAQWQEPSSPEALRDELKKRRALRHDLEKHLSDVCAGASLSLEITPTPLTDFWQGAGDGTFGGLCVTLPDVVDVEANGLIDRWQVWIELSRLGNHCLYMETVLTGSTPTDLYRALRGPAYYMRGQEVRYELVEPGGLEKMGAAGWRSIDDLASDIIMTVAAGMLQTRQSPGAQEAPARLNGQYYRSQHHVVAVITMPESLGVQAPAIASALQGWHGGRLFQVNVNYIASTLAEWLRYPLVDSISRSNLVFVDDWIARLDGVTTFGVLGNPSWQTMYYVEAVQFAASWEPLLVMWDRQVMQALADPDAKTRSLELRKLEREVRRHISVVHSEDLCGSRTYRRFLDEEIASFGVAGREGQLEQQLDSVKLLISEQEHVAQENADKHRNRLLATLAVFGVFSITSLFGLLEHSDDNGAFDGPLATCIEGVVLFILVILTLWLVYRNVWRYQYQNDSFSGRASRDDAAHNASVSGEDRERRTHRRHGRHRIGKKNLRFPLGPLFSARRN